LAEFRTFLLGVDTADGWNRKRWNLLPEHSYASLVNPNCAHSRLAALILLPAGLLYGQTTNPLELIKQPTPPPSERITYGKNPLQFGELRVPAGAGPFPVAILVHGGCWSRTVGTLPEAVTSFELLRPIAAALATAGIASWNIEYRRLGNVGGGWPGTYRDLSNATDLLRELSPRYHLDLQRVIAIGHSSGGQLAFWLAARGRLTKGSALHTDSPLPLKGAVSVDGPPDLEADRAIEQSVCGGPVVTQFLGGTPAEFPERYREGASSGLLPIGVRQELILAGNHNAEWIGLFKQYVAAAEKAGDPVRMPVMDGAGHFDGIDPRRPGWQTVTESVRFLLSAPQLENRRSPTRTGKTPRPEALCGTHFDRAPVRPESAGTQRGRCRRIGSI
jgi:acetyl esterase/lipase